MNIVYGDSPQTTREKVRELNDAFRKNLGCGVVMITHGFAALQRSEQQIIVEMIQSYDAFDDDAEPWGKHEFISVEHRGQTILRED